MNHYNRLQARDLWSRIFSALLALPAEGAAPPAPEALDGAAAALESWIGGDATRARGVKTLLMRQNMVLSRESMA